MQTSNARGVTDYIVACRGETTSRAITRTAYHGDMSQIIHKIKQEILSESPRAP